MAYDDISNESWYSLLNQLLQDMTIDQILSIPGVYESVSEELNNEVIELWESQQNEGNDDGS